MLVNQLFLISTTLLINTDLFFVKPFYNLVITLACIDESKITFEIHFQ